MVQKETKLFVADNSGAKFVRCIRVFKKTHGSFGDFILVTLQIFNRDKLLLKKKKYAGLIISSCKIKRRLNGITLKHNKNRIVLFLEKDVFAGSRIYGPLCKELRNKSLNDRFKRLVSFAHKVI